MTTTPALLADVRAWCALYLNDARIASVREVCDRLEAADRAARDFAESLDNIREALGLEETHYLIIADEVRRIAWEVAALESRLIEAESNYARCAHAIGVEDVQDCGPSYPGPIDEVEREIREDARRAALVEEYSEKLSALEARCQALETALDRCIGSDGQAGLYALGSLSEESYFERGGNNETTDRYRAMADEIVDAAKKARAGT